MFFDSHCHLTDERLYPQAEAVVARARENEVTRLVTIGADPDDIERARDLAQRIEGVWAAVGVHPHVADRLDAAILDRLAELAGSDRVVAIGETGLDYHYDNAPRAAQRRAFLAQLELAERVGLPVVVHTRDADADTSAILRDAGRAVRGVLHCFAGGRELLEAGLEAGWFISFSGIVTFRNFAGADLLRAVPADRLLIETDSPYLAPVPMRGRTNEPAFVRHVAEAVARWRDEPLAEVASRTAGNACALYGIED